MSLTTICATCRTITWRSERMELLYNFLSRNRTSREIADEFGWSVQNANGKLKALASLGLATVVEERQQDTGGYEKVWSRVVPTTWEQRK